MLERIRVQKNIKARSTNESKHQITTNKSPDNSSARSKLSNSDDMEVLYITDENGVKTDAERKYIPNPISGTTPPSTPGEDDTKSRFATAQIKHQTTPQHHEVDDDHLQIAQVVSLVADNHYTDHCHTVEYVNAGNTTTDSADEYAPATTTSQNRPKSEAEQPQSPIKICILRTGDVPNGQNSAAGARNTNRLEPTHDPINVNHTEDTDENNEDATDIILIKHGNPRNGQNDSYVTNQSHRRHGNSSSHNNNNNGAESLDDEMDITDADECADEDDDLVVDSALQSFGASASRYPSVNRGLDNQREILQLRKQLMLREFEMVRQRHGLEMEQREQRHRIEMEMLQRDMDFKREQHQKIVQCLNKRLRQK